jgi:hypothetical protein
MFVQIRTANKAQNSSPVSCKQRCRQLLFAKAAGWANIFAFKKQLPGDGRSLSFQNFAYDRCFPSPVLRSAEAGSKFTLTCSVRPVAGFEAQPRRYIIRWT